MTQLIVTVEDHSLLPLIKKAIGLLKGVSSVAVWKSDKKQKETAAKETAVYPADVSALIGIASSISKKDIDSDERLSYLLNK